MSRSLALGVLVAGLLLGMLPLAAAAKPSPFQSLADRVYFEQTGHEVSEPFLSYWWNNGGLDRFGFPITEVQTIDGVETQYFERARFEYHPDNDPNWRVELGLLGSEQTAGRADAAFRRITPSGPFHDSKDRSYFAATGHFLSYGFKSYWEENGGLPVFGYPLSEEFSEKNASDGNTYTVQYFERGRFEYHPEFKGTHYEVELGLLGTYSAAKAGLSTAGVAQPAGAPVWPDGKRNPSKWIEVNLSTPQTLTAWEGDRAVYTAYVSGGTDQHPTVTGTFAIYWKLDKQDMSGGRAGDDDYYYLPDVPWVMYFYEDYAIHGAYWHANWGYPISHGCVNMPIPDADWLYHWAPTGTKVWVHY
ncbi:MAG TPA: L,D-transpeptidase [Thermomicrobiaceae bacterium]|nr:L,D-transpeptidase [Thermomicrobiaceae bacterium]